MDDEKKILYTEELKKRYSIKYKNKVNIKDNKLNDNNEINDDNELNDKNKVNIKDNKSNDDNEIISLLVKKIESLKSKNKILKEEIEFLKLQI